jgi:hypothetical protein
LAAYVRCSPRAAACAPSHGRKDGEHPGAWADRQHGCDTDIFVVLGADSDVLAIHELRELLVPVLGDRGDAAYPEVLRKVVLVRALEEAVAL